MHDASLQPPTPERLAPSWSIRRESGRWLHPDLILRLLTNGAAGSILLMLAMLVVVVFLAALPSIRQFGWAFVSTSEWRANEIEVTQIRRTPEGRPVIEDGEVVKDVVAVKPPTFGALPVIWGTAVSSAMALLFAVPLSLGAALFLVRIAPRRLISPVSILIEFLAAIPSIAYGIWGLFVLVPFMQKHVTPLLQRVVGAVPGLGFLREPLTPTGLDMFTASAVLAIMVLPIITALARDVLRAVPRIQIEGTLALGATWWQSCKGMLSYSRSGLFGAVMLGLARAAGETMAVTMVIGNAMKISASPFMPAQTMASLLANQFPESSGLQRSALMEVALILLLMSLAFNIVARWLVVGAQGRTSAAH